MIIIMAGLPKSGKSTLAKNIVDKIITGSSFTVDPAVYVPPELTPESGKAYREAMLGAWEFARERLKKLSSVQPDSTVIIFDTCASKNNVVKSIVDEAKENNHRTLLVYVDTPSNTCLERGSGVINRDVIKHYERAFVKSLKKSTELCDSFVVMEGSGEFNEAHKKKLASFINADTN